MMLGNHYRKGVNNYMDLLRTYEQKLMEEIRRPPATGA